MDALPRRSRASGRSGFSMVEALLGVTIATIAGAAMLTSVGAAVSATQESKNSNVARALADQLMDEIAGVRFPAPGLQLALSAADRSSFEDIDDYSGLIDMPPRTRAGQLIGSESLQTDNGSIDRPTQTVVDAVCSARGGRSHEISIDRPTQTVVDAAYMQRFGRSVSVERVEPDAYGSWNVLSAHTDHRRVTVNVWYADYNNNMVPLARVTRVFSNVAFTP